MKVDEVMEAHELIIARSQIAGLLVALKTRPSNALYLQCGKPLIDEGARVVDGAESARVSNSVAICAVTIAAEAISARLKELGVE